MNVISFSVVDRVHLGRYHEKPVKNVVGRLTGQSVCVRPSRNSKTPTWIEGKHCHPKCVIVRAEKYLIDWFARSGFTRAVSGRTYLYTLGTMFEGLLPS